MYTSSRQNGERSNENVASLTINETNESARVPSSGLSQIESGTTRTETTNDPDGGDSDGRLPSGRSVRFAQNAEEATNEAYNVNPSLPDVELPIRRLSLQTNSSGNPIRSVSSANSPTPESIFPHGDLYWNVLPSNENELCQKMPTGSRHYTPRSYVNESTPQTHRSPPSYSLNDPNPAHGGPLERNAESALGRPHSTMRNRPVSTAVNRTRATGHQRIATPRFSWPQYASSNNALHQPPSGPDCLPGCGYSGLPCYVCSTKNTYSNQSSRTQSSRMSIWSILTRPENTARVHASSRERGPLSQAMPDPSNSGTISRSNHLSMRLCFKKIADSVHIPNSRVKQLGLTCLIIYILMILHIGITRLIRGYNL